MDSTSIFQSDGNVIRLTLCPHTVIATQIKKAAKIAEITLLMIVPSIYADVCKTEQTYLMITF